MNKKTLRAFAFGILISVCLMGTVYYVVGSEVSNLNTKNAKAFLENTGFVVMTSEQHNTMEKELAEAKEKASNAEAQLKEKQPATNKEEEKEAIINFNLKIVSRMLLQDIAAELEKEKIIDDANQFKQYMVDYGYSRKIQPGTFSLTSSMSFKEIAKIITKR